MKRTVVPRLIVSVARSNAALVVPLPVIFTSTTATGSVAGATVAGAGVAASAWDAAGFFSPPQATAPNATMVLSRVNRIADVLQDDGWRELVTRSQYTRALAKRESCAPRLAVAFLHDPHDTEAHAPLGSPATSRRPDLPAAEPRTARARPGRARRGDLRPRQLQPAGDPLPAGAGVRRVLGDRRHGC